LPPVPLQRSDYAAWIIAAVLLALIIELHLLSALLAGLLVYKLVDVLTPWLRVRAMDDDVEFLVVDTGIGIPARDLPRLGQRFEQVDNAMTRRREGTGLGLALCRSLTELHKGRITITSEVGQGTTVSVRLPRGVRIA